ncbi:MAG: glycosyltransferase family 39 protein [Hyphomonadaceae bacterium]|nr:glycosyltransferase family 39 protein [Hyphomonadaceae bacterium]
MTRTLRDHIAAAIRTPRGAGLAALFLILLMVLPGQTTIPPIDRDEPRFAQATRQMLETGDFVDIRFLDQPRHLQPAGIYWFQAAAVSLVGDADVRAIWPHRVPSWLAAVATVFLTWWAGGLLFGRDAGRIAATLMGACLIVGVEARLAKIDSMLCATTLLAQASLARAFIARERAEALNVWWVIAFWAALGVGGLLKGPIVLLVTGGTVLGLIALERRARWLGALKPLWGAPLMLAIAAPWYVAIGFATDGAFYRTAVGYSVVGKVAGSHQNHGGPIGYHALLFSAVFWPGSLFAWLAVPFAWAQRRAPAVRFCLAWIIPAWIVFEFSGTKLPHYTLPLLPAVAMLCAAAILDAGAQRWFGRPRLFLAAAVVWLLLAGLFLAGAPALRLELQQDQGVGPLLLGGVGLLGAGLTLALIAQGRARAGVVAMAATALVAWTNLFAFTLPAMDKLFLSPRVVAALADERRCPLTRLALLDYHEPSLVFLYGPGVVLTRTPEEAATAVAADPACTLALTASPGRAGFLEAMAAQGMAVREIAAISGENYNEADEGALTIYRATR